MSNTMKATGKQRGFDADAAVAELSDEPFPLTLGGQARELPNAGALSTEQLVTVAAAANGIESDPSQLRGMLVEIVGDEIAADLLRLPLKVFADVLDAWMSDGGVELGGLPASPDSLPSTASR